MKIHVFNQLSDQKGDLSLERGTLFGDGFFTTGIVKQGKICFLEEHLTRIKNSALRLKFSNIDCEQLVESINKEIADIKQAVFRLSFIREQKIRGYAISPDQKTKVLLHLSNWQEKPNTLCEVFFAQTPITINPLFAGIKHLNRLDNVFAASECIKPNQEALLCDGEYVISGSRSNCFFYFDHTWHTPLLSQAGIEGITKQRLLTLSQDKQIPIIESHITREQTLQSEAAFVTNSIFGIWPISKIENNLLDTQRCLDLQSDLDFYSY